MIIPRNDWKEHTPEDFKDLDARVQDLASHLLRLFEEKPPYAIILVEDYSDETKLAENGFGDRRIIGWFEIKGPSDIDPKKTERVGYIRLHADEHIEASRCLPDFISLFGESIQCYKGKTNLVERF